MQKSKRKQEEQTVYGVVLVMNGRHRYKVGYYDDDEEDKAVVYFGTPLLSACTLISPKYLKNIKIPILSYLKSKIK